MEHPSPCLRRFLVAHARHESFVPHTRSILAKLGYAIVLVEELADLPVPLAQQVPDLRIADERRLAEIPDDEDGVSVPIVVLSGREGVTGADPRIVGAVPRPAGAHELYRVIQQTLEETPRSTPRVPTHLAACCRQGGKEWRASVLSLSESGCLVRSPEPVALGSSLELSFDLPRLGVIETRAEAAYQMPPDLGLVFHQISATSRRAVLDFVTRTLQEI